MTRKTNKIPKKMLKLIKNVKLVNGESSIVLDENTPQDVLEQYSKHEVGKGFIELVATPAAQIQENAKAGQ
ncbi:hypothetical protein M0L20_13655 [Spirosoma sp. RP8]|uniref:Bacillus phage SPbeta YonK domain-containing protein n=1 Tax=Spirosoma liriopis TaxID=2937440 RepID=A0ABT0HMM9_9BACT|nr:hypothetical protein [Spirosoma liriopis]MCK8492908.1 hypothetical protein [Spirosoma liriopis]